MTFCRDTRVSLGIRRSLSRNKNTEEFSTVLPFAFRSRLILFSCTRAVADGSGDHRLLWRHLVAARRATTNGWRAIFVALWCAFASENDSRSFPISWRVSLRQVSARWNVFDDALSWFALFSLIFRVARHAYAVYIFAFRLRRSILPLNGVSLVWQNKHSWATWNILKFYVRVARMSFVQLECEHGEIIRW